MELFANVLPKHDSEQPVFCAHMKLSETTKRSSTAQWPSIHCTFPYRRPCIVVYQLV